MLLTISNGRFSALQEVQTLLPKYKIAYNYLSSYINLYKEACPIGYAIAHILSVNPKLEVAPKPSKDGRRGFMFATNTMAKYAGVKWEKLDDLNICAFVWGYDINKTAESIYKKYYSFFSNPNADFWNTTYLKHYIGDTSFNLLWNYRDISQDKIYLSLLNGVDKVRQRIGPYTVNTFRNATLYKSQFVVEMAKKAGKVSSDTWYTIPVLTKNNMLEIYEN